MALFTVPLIAVAIYMAAGVASANMEIRQAGYDAGVLGQGTTAPDSVALEHTALLVCPFH